MSDLVGFVQWVSRHLPMPDFCSKCDDEVQEVHMFTDLPVCKDCFREGWYVMEQGIAYEGPFPDVYQALAYRA